MLFLVPSPQRQSTDGISTAFLAFSALISSLAYGQYCQPVFLDNVQFLHADALPDVQPTVSEHWGTELGVKLSGTRITLLACRCVRYYFEGPCGSTLPEALAPHDSETRATWLTSQRWQTRNWSTPIPHEWSDFLDLHVTRSVLLSVYSRHLFGGGFPPPKKTYNFPPMRLPNCVI